MNKHDYGLTWIDNDALYYEAKRNFDKFFAPERNKKQLPPDPFLILTQALITGESLNDSLGFEKTRKINKSLSNALGDMHQGILGLAPHWTTLGTAGGVLDIKTVDGYVHPVIGKPVVAEVKNRFNTIKASDEKDVWDKIDAAARLTNSQGYLFQIVPADTHRYDEKWEPSGRKAKNTVRRCDGATAYEIVFEYKNALHELYEALPAIFADIRSSDSMVSTIDRKTMELLYSSVFPA